MSPIQLVKIVLSVVVAVFSVVAAGVRFWPRRVPQPASVVRAAEPARDSDRKSSGLGPILLGTSGIVALLSTALTVVVNHFDQEAQRADERSRRAVERIDDLYNHGIETLASGTPVLQVVGVYEIGGVIQALEGPEDYDESAREILAGNLRVFAPSSSGAAATPVAPPASSRPVIRAIVDVLGKQHQSSGCRGESQPSAEQTVDAENDSRQVPANLAGVNFRDQQLANTNFNTADLRAADFAYADLSFATLCDADLTRANLTNVNFNDANLSDADLTGAYLTDATLTDADLSFANLTDASLISADLDRANLQSATLDRTDLSEANLRTAQFSGARISDSHFMHADVRYADFSGENREDHVSFFGVNLSFADLSGANLRGVYLTGADIHEATLIVARFIGAELQYADLTKVDLSEADLRSASLYGVTLNDATLDCAILSGADFRDPDRDTADAMIEIVDILGVEHAVTQLPGADFRFADLSDAQFGPANLLGATFEGANLAGANLAETNLTQDQLNTAFIDERTVLPKGLDRQGVAPSSEYPTQARCLRFTHPDRYAVTPLGETPAPSG